MKSITGILITIGVCAIAILSLYITAKLQPIVEQPSQELGNTTPAVVADDSITNITKDLNDVSDDSTVASELNALDVQLNSF